MAHTVKAADIDGTIDALQQDLSAMPLDHAISIIDSWQEPLQGQLQGSDISATLIELKQALESGNNGAIAQLLTTLSQNTMQIHANLTGDIAEKVKQVGTLLEQAGQKNQ